MNRKLQMKIARAAVDDPVMVAPMLRQIEKSRAHSKAWRHYAARLADFLELYLFTDYEKARAPFSVFIENGNSKLPFVAFSVLPIVTCPGAGECVNFCYSLRAWRYPAAFFRQLQNTFLMGSWHGRLIIDAELDRLEKKKKFAAGYTMRLYVDGDFARESDLAYWMAQFHARPKIAAYGYSKSFGLFLRHHEKSAGYWPSNYILNISSGHNATPGIIAEMYRLPITRGNFIAVDIGSRVDSSMHGTRDHNQKLRAAYGARAFTCPGKCGNCTPSGHACGSARFRGVDVIIAAH